MSAVAIPSNAAPAEQVLLRFGSKRLTLMHVDFVVITLWFAVIAAQFKYDELLLYPMALYFVFAFVRDRHATWPVFKRGWILLVVPAWYLMSSLWSPEPFQAFRTGILVILSMVICMFMASRLTVRTLMILVMLSTLLVVLHSFGKITRDFMAWGFTKGIHSSKNAFGIDMAVLWVTAFAVMVTPAVNSTIRIIALCCLPLSLVLVFASESVTAILLSIGMSGIVIMAVLYFGRNINVVTTTRIFLIISTIFLSLVIIIFIINFTPVNVIDEVLGAFGKDRGLTGRTGLWDIAVKEIGERPILGTGAKGFWVYDENSAVRQIFIDYHKKRGNVFHFHNSWLEIGVGLGLIGVTLAFVSLSWAFAVAVRRALTLGGALHWALLAIACAVVLRTMTEAALFTQFVRLDMILWTGVLIVSQQNISRRITQSNTILGHGSGWLLARPL